MKVIADNKIPGIYSLLSEDFDLKLLPLEEINVNSLRDADILICRSVLRVNQALLEDTAVKIVASANSGTDHIDKAYLDAQGIQLFSAPGSNAQGVADYMLWMIAYLVKQGAFSDINSGCFHGKTAGIIGAGHVGTKVQDLLTALGFEVFMNDPPRVARDPNFVSTDLADIAQKDLICIHAELTKEGLYPSYHLLSANWFKLLNKNVSKNHSTILINAARGGLINTQDLLASKINHHTPNYLCVDVFENEPNISEPLVKECFMTTPHIAGHTVESFFRASQMVVDKIREYVGLPLLPHKKKLEDNSAWWERGISAIEPVDARDCKQWYEVILKLYDFHSALELTLETFYTLRESHRFRHDFSEIPIRLGHDLKEPDRLLLRKLQLIVENNDEK